MMLESVDASIVSCDLQVEGEHNKPHTVIFDTMFPIHCATFVRLG